MLRLNVFLFFIFFYNITQASIYSDYKVRKAFSKNEFKEAVQILEKEQVETPHEPILNYNLGTAYYKLNNFYKAKSNLKRSIDNCSIISDKKLQSNIKEKAYFNWGNSLYKSGLKLLGKDWEKEKVDNKTLDLAITEIKSSIEKYRNVLVLNKDNKWAISNKKNAEDLLKKLEEKKQQNQKDQKNNDNKDSKSNSDDKKDSSQKEDKNSQSQNSEQKSKKEDGSENSKENRNKWEDEEFDNKQAGQEKQDMDKKEQNSSSEQNGEQKQNQSTKKDNDQGSKNQETGSGNEKSTQEERDDSKPVDSQQVGTQQVGTQQVGTQQVGTQQVGVEEKNDVRSKILRSILDNLQNNEVELQKALIKRKSIGQRPRLDQGQKPW